MSKDNNYIVEDFEDRGGCFSRWSLYVDENGRPVAKTPVTHPYSYDAFVVWGKKIKGSSAVYTDRLWQWDSKKYNDLRMKHFGDKSQGWRELEPKKIEAFLRDYENNPKLVLTMVMECCNVSNGYPLWIFFFTTQ